MPSLAGTGAYHMGVSYIGVRISRQNSAQTDQAVTSQTKIEIPSFAYRFLSSTIPTRQTVVARLVPAFAAAYQRHVHDCTEHAPSLPSCSQLSAERSVQRAVID